QRFAIPPPTRFGVLVPDPAPPAPPPPQPASAGATETAVTQRSTLGPDLDLPMRTLPVLDDGVAQPSGGPVAADAGGDVTAQATPSPIADLLGGTELDPPLQGLWETPAPGQSQTDDGSPGVTEATLSRLSEPGDDRPRRLGLGEPMSAVPSPIQRIIGRLAEDPGTNPTPAPGPPGLPPPEATALFAVPRLGPALPGVPSLQRQAERTPGPTAPRPDTGHDQRGPDVLIFQAPPSAPETVVSRSAEFPVDPPPPPEPPAAPPAAPVPDAFPMVQREAETTPGPEPAAGPSAPGAVAVGPGGVNLDELAKRLYGRLSSQLRAELRLDRERAGFLSDLGR
ncbi:MAG: hypothetical protein ACRDZ3_07400, partial [Acidimicrobiia bacterium]